MADGALSRNTGRSFFATLSALIAPPQPKGVKAKTAQKAKAEPKLEYVTGKGQDTFGVEEGASDETRAFLGEDLDASRGGLNRSAARHGARRMSGDHSIDPDENGGASTLFSGAGSHSIESKAGVAVDQAFSRVVDAEATQAQAEEVQGALPAHRVADAIAIEGPSGDAQGPVKVNGGEYVHALRTRRDDLQTYDGGSLLKPAAEFAISRPADALLGGGPGVRASDFAVPPSHPNAAAWLQAKDWVSDTAHGLGVIPAIGSNAARIGFFSDLVREKLR